MAYSIVVYTAAVVLSICSKRPLPSNMVWLWLSWSIIGDCSTWGHPVLALGCATGFRLVQRFVFSRETSTRANQRRVSLKIWRRHLSRGLAGDLYGDTAVSTHDTGFLPSMCVRRHWGCGAHAPCLVCRSVTTAKGHVCDEAESATAVQHVCPKTSLHQSTLPRPNINISVDTLAINLYYMCNIEGSSSTGNHAPNYNKKIQAVAAGSLTLGYSGVAFIAVAPFLPLKGLT